MLGADIILTGTFSPTGDKWNVNLRLINTESGQIISAINLLDSIREFKEVEFREIQNITANFEDKRSTLEGWMFGERFENKLGKDGSQKVYISENEGASGSSSLLVLKYKLGTERIRKKESIRAEVTNLLKRDLTNYSGIQFSVKSSEDITFVFVVVDSQKNLSEFEAWFKTIPITTKWKNLKIPFRSLVVNKKHIRDRGTNGILSLDKIELIKWVVNENQVKKGSEGTLWIDEVSFY